MEWARGNGYAVFTHDLDFGTLLATIGGRLVRIFRQYESVLERGALVTVDETKSRVRILPFQ